MARRKLKEVRRIDRDHVEFIYETIPHVRKEVHGEMRNVYSDDARGEYYFAKIAEPRTGRYGGTYYVEGRRKVYVNGPDLTTLLQQDHESEISFLKCLGAVILIGLVTWFGFIKPYSEAQRNAEKMAVQYCMTAVGTVSYAKFDACKKEQTSALMKIR